MWKLPEKALVRRVLRLIRERQPESRTILEALAAEWKIDLDPPERDEQDEKRVVSRYGRASKKEVRSAARRKAARAERTNLPVPQERHEQGVPHVPAVDAAGETRGRRARGAGMELRIRVVPDADGDPELKN
jgi:hypothetical protein